MQVRDEWKKTISRKQYFLTIGIVVLLLGGMGFIYFQTGHIPAISPAFVGILLLVTWIGAFVHLLRYGKRAFPPLRVAFLVGITLFLGSALLPLQVITILWMKNIGAGLLVVSMMTDFFTVRQSR